MMTKSKTTAYIVHSIAAAVLMLNAQVSLAGSATWLSSPQDSAWENANNWTLGGPPNGPSDTATFVQSSQTGVAITTSEEVNGLVFASNSNAFTLNIPPYCPGCPNIGGELIISGTGVNNNSSVLQTFEVGGAGQLIFNNTSSAASAYMSIGNYDVDVGVGGRTIFNDMSSAAGASIGNGSAEFGLGADIGRTIFNDASTAGHASISNNGVQSSHGVGGQTTFNGTSTAAYASIDNHGSNGNDVGGGLTIFNDTSTAGHATITSHSEFPEPSAGGGTIFNGSSTAGSATLIANGIVGGGIVFAGASTGGTARVKLFDNGSLGIDGHQGGLTIGSIEGSGNVFLGANRLRVGANDISTSFSGVISNNGGGSLAKIGSGVLTLQANHCIGDTVGLILVSSSIINLDFTGPPDPIASLTVNGVPQAPGIYGGPMSGAPHTIPEFAGTGTVRVGLVVALGNISTRAFVQTGDNVMIGGFIVQGTEPKRVIIRAIGPGLTQYGVPQVLADPTLELHDGAGAVIASNNDWQHTIIGGIITRDQVRDIQNSGYAPGNAREPAIIAQLPPGNYTAVIRGINNTRGVALAEAYDLSPETMSILSNISTRSFVGTGDYVMIGGFIIPGTGPKRVIVRAIGPELTRYGVPNALADPTLELHDQFSLLASNDNWMTTIIGGIITRDQVSDIRNSGHAPADLRESAIIAELPPGNYTAIVRGVNNTTGIGLVEVYDLP